MASRITTTADLNVLSIERIEPGNPRVRDLPPFQEWGYVNEPDAEGWLPLTGVLAGGYVNREIFSIAAKDLTSDPIRGVREYRVRFLTTKFNPAKIGTLLVSFRTDGSRVVIEGNHRLVTVRDRLKRPDFRFRCEAYKGLTLPQEAFLWGAEEDRLRPSPLEDLIGRVQEREPNALGIKRALDAHGVTMRGARGEHDVWPFVENGVQIEKAYLLHGESALSAAVGYAKRAWQGKWPEARGAFDGHLLMALCYLISVYGSRLDGSRLDGNRLVERLSLTSTKKLRAAATTLLEMVKVRVPNGYAQCLASIIAGDYNTNLRSRRLADWEWVK